MAYHLVREWAVIGSYQVSRVTSAIVGAHKVALVWIIIRLGLVPYINSLSILLILVLLHPGERIAFAIDLFLLLFNEIILIFHHPRLFLELFKSIVDSRYVLVVRLVQRSTTRIWLL